jgi:hypothetical protein
VWSELPHVRGSWNQPGLFSVQIDLSLTHLPPSSMQFKTVHNLSLISNNINITSVATCFSLTWSSTCNCSLFENCRTAVDFSQYISMLLHIVTCIWLVHVTKNYGTRRLIGFINNQLQTHTRLHLYTSSTAL